jgi:uncharacterized membrane protein YeaQ/YmgE (transglycosylase-associated protein family)
MRPILETEGMGAALAAVPLVAAKGDNLRLDTDIGSILGYILVGLIVGLLARMLVPGRDPVGLLGTLAIGVVGAVLGGWLAGAFFKETGGGRLARLDRGRGSARAARPLQLPAQGLESGVGGSGRCARSPAPSTGQSRRGRRVPSHPLPAGTVGA